MTKAINKVIEIFMNKYVPYVLLWSMILVRGKCDKGSVPYVCVLPDLMGNGIAIYMVNGGRKFRCVLISKYVREKMGVGFLMRSNFEYSCNMITCTFLF